MFRLQYLDVREFDAGISGGVPVRAARVKTRRSWRDTLARG